MGRSLSSARRVSLVSLYLCLCLGLPGLLPYMRTEKVTVLMEIESVYQKHWIHQQPQSCWVEYVRINGGAAHLSIVVGVTSCRAVLSIWTLEKGYQPFLVLPEGDVRGQPIEQVREQLLKVAEGMLRT